MEGVISNILTLKLTDFSLKFVVAGCLMVIETTPEPEIYAVNTIVAPVPVDRICNKSGFDDAISNTASGSVLLEVGSAITKLRSDVILFKSGGKLENIGVDFMIFIRIVLVDPDVSPISVDERLYIGVSSCKNRIEIGAGVPSGNRVTL